MYLGGSVPVVPLEVSIKVIQLVQEGDVCSCGVGVAWSVVSDGLDALPQKPGVGFGE